MEYIKLIPVCLISLPPKIDHKRTLKVGAIPKQTENKPIT